MSFRQNQAPKGYIPGLGRGASGFTTRSDIGPIMSETTETSGTGSRASELREARLKSPFGVAPKGYIAGAGRGASMGESDDVGPTGLEDAMQDVEDEEDIEADMIYEAVEKRLATRRKKRGNVETSSTTRIGDQFRELKEKLSSVTEEEWDNIPDIGDYSLRHKQKRREDVFTPISDSLLGSRSSLNDDANGRGLSGTTAAVDGYQSVNMSGLAEARGTVLGMSLDKMSSTDTTIDPKGYLTSLSTLPIASNAEVNDINKARLLLKSVRDTNPKHAPAWIASARVEETANKIHTARKLIQDGCEACPSNEDIWLEASRLHPPPKNKVILASAIQHIPKSVKIFIAAADLETSTQAKKLILRKALEAIPTSITIWKAAVDLEEEKGALLLLQLATEKVPHCVDFWLALAKLETYENAKKVLNQARKALPAEKAIWITAAKLEESHGSDQASIDKIIQNGLIALSRNDAVISREQWMQEATKAELVAHSPLTSASIIKYTIGLGVDPEDRLRTWTSDASSVVSSGAINTARAILAHALASFTKKSLWIQAVELEQNHGTPSSLDSVLEEACKNLPKIELFWLLRAKEQWTTHQNIDKAREILTAAFAANPDSESVWLAAAKLEWESEEVERARVLLKRARDTAPTPRVFMKSAMLERENENFDQAIELLNEGIKRYPKAAKLYMMGGQISCKLDNLTQARKFYQRGIENCSTNPILWNLASQLEESHGTKNKARSLLELARIKNPNNEHLWLASIRFELKHDRTVALSLLAKAIKECPKSGILLAESIRIATRVEQKSKSAHAIQKCPDDPNVILAVASLFASERKVAKARKWFERAINLNTDIGDHWVKYYIFENEFGSVEQRDEVKKRCVGCEPKYGEVWCSVSKCRRRMSCGEIFDLVVEKMNEK